MLSGHWWTFLRQAESIHGTGPASIVENEDGTISRLMKPAGTLGSWLAAAWINMGEYGVFNIRSFGAVGDGVTNDSLAFDAATAAAALYNSTLPNDHPGGVIYCPPGNYCIFWSIRLPSYTQLIGSFRGNSQIFANAGLLQAQGTTNYTAVMVCNEHYFGSTPPQQIEIAVKDLTFDGNAPNNPQSWSSTTMGSGATVAFQNTTDVTISGLKIFSCPNHAITVDAQFAPTPLLKAANIRILDNTIDIVPTRSLDPETGTGNLISGNLNIRLYAMQGVLIRGNIIGFSYPDGTNAQTWSNDGIDTPGCWDVIITENLMTYVTDGIGVSDGYTYSITNNVIDNFIGLGIRSFSGQGGGMAVSDIVIADNVVIGSLYQSTNPFNMLTPGRCGIHVDAGPQTPTPSETYRAAVTGNTVKGPFVVAGIQFQGTYGSVTGNSVDVNSSNYVFTLLPGITLEENDCNAVGNRVVDSSVSIAPAAGTVGIQVPTPFQGKLSVQSGVTISGNSVTLCYVGIDLENSLANCAVTANNVRSSVYGIQIAASVAGPPQPSVNGLIISDNIVNASGAALNLGSFASFTLVRIAGNVGINPPLSGVSYPSFSSGTVTNNTGFDCTVYLKGGVSLIKVNGQSIGLSGSTSLTVPLPIHLMANGNVQVTAAGVPSPSWIWIAE
jgi:parallel beta-helix repeat protein